MAELLSDQVEQQVLEWLPWVEEEMLIQICGELAIQIPPNKTSKTMILKLILKYLHSEAVESSEDEGMSIFLHSDLSTHMKKTDEKKKGLSDEGRTMGRFENNVSEVESKKGKFSTIDKGDFAVHRLRDFKINGVVGGAEQKDTLSYTSLSFQMKQGKGAGYSSKEICAAVIRAIKPGSNLS